MTATFLLSGQIGKGSKWRPARWEGRKNMLNTHDRAVSCMHSTNQPTQILHNGNVNVYARRVVASCAATSNSLGKAYLATGLSRVRACEFFVVGTSELANAGHVVQCVAPAESTEHNVSARNADFASYSITGALHENSQQSDSSQQTSPFARFLAVLCFSDNGSTVRRSSGARRGRQRRRRRPGYRSETRRPIRSRLRRSE
jgi:hypothetical protein